MGQREAAAEAARRRLTAKIVGSMAGDRYVPVTYLSPGVPEGRGRAQAANRGSSELGIGLPSLCVPGIA